ncbi:F-box protein At5g03100-like [Phoenix dactylifera]|uniref:F-box protein At5g03100-like n=1 Tax=Phoenix dactylifera TaxID=42345 RepID=A0A8B7CUE8_PHODC|nr:F-box protein At5g03100-like [Phoenix dactylifera]
MARDGCIRRDCPRDRLTELPDSLRLQILGLLPRKDAIKTGVLSTQWKGLWKQRFAYSTELLHDRVYKDAEDQQEFIIEIEKAMQQYQNRRIEVFRLNFYPDKSYENTMKEWIAQALSRGAEELHLDFSQGLTSGNPDGRLKPRRKKPLLNDTLFRGNSLIVLSLKYCRIYKWFKFTHLGSLEALHLHGLNITDFSLANLITNCPLLKKLELCECLTLQWIRVSGPNLRLKNLHVVHCGQVNAIEISAPNLQMFHLVGRFPRILLLFDVSSLNNVYISSYHHDYWDHRYRQTWARMFRDFEHVEALTLRSRGIQYVFGPSRPAVASRLHNQELCRQIAGDILSEVYKILTRWGFPRLEHLFIEFPDALEDPAMKYVLERTQQWPPELDFKQLRTLYMFNFEARAHHVRLLEHFLCRAAALERVFLLVPPHFDINLNNNSCMDILRYGLLDRPKASPNCQIFFLHPAQNGHAPCPRETA